MKTFRGLKNSGLSLVELLVSLAILGVVTAAMMSLISTQRNELKALNEKLTISTIKSTVTAALADGSVCLYELNNPSVKTFNSLTPANANASVIDVNQIRVKAAASSPFVVQVSNTAPAFSDAPTVYVNRIYVTNFVGSGTSYTANWIISFDSSKLYRPLRDISIPVTMTVDNSNPAATRIIGCMTTGPTSAGEVLSGTHCGLRIYGDGRGSQLVLCNGHDPGSSCPTGYYAKSFPHFDYVWQVTCIKQ